MSKYTTEHAYGWQRDVPDVRDHRVSIVAPIKLPASVDLRPAMPEVYDQGQLGSCTANAIAAAFDFERHLQGLAFINPARLWIYYNERAIEHTIMSDSGAQIRDGVRVVNTLGVVPETEWPYDISKFTRKPSAQVYADAKKDLALDYARVPQDQKSMQQVLAAGRPIIIGFTVYQSFESDAVAQAGVVSMPVAGEKTLGGHAVLIVGYKKLGKQLVWIVRNSWSNTWGDQGYFYMPSDYFTNDDLASDLWCVKKVEA